MSTNPIRMARKHCAKTIGSSIKLPCCRLNIITCKINNTVLQAKLIQTNALEKKTIARAPTQIYKGALGAKRPFNVCITNVAILQLIIK